MNENIIRTMALLVEIVNSKNNSCTDACTTECSCASLKKKAADAIINLLPLLEKEKDVAMSYLNQYSAKQCGIIS